MAIALVSEIGSISFNTATTHAFTVPVGGVAAGNVVILRLCTNSETITISSVTDTQGNTYTVNVSHASPGDNTAGFIVSGQITTPLVNGNTITVTPSATVALGGEATEWSELATSAVFDKSAVASTGFGTSWSSGATAMTAQADELCIGVYVITNDVRSTPEGTWTEQSDKNYVAPGPGRSMVTQYKIVSATGTYAAQGTLASNSDGAALIATYKAAAAGGPAPAVNDAATVTEDVTMTMHLRNLTVNETASVAENITMHMPIHLRMEKLS